MLAILGPPAPAISGLACSALFPHRKRAQRQRNLLIPQVFLRDEVPILSRLSKVSGSIPAGKDRDENIPGWDVVDKLA
ncbi:hypothetical protein [Phyllobacterium sp. SL163]|uniref:hypothetical protein n=1 Tax=unclassified Phyllobacterium TaxID=2638441 RepID=UPI003CF58828